EAERSLCLHALSSFQRTSEARTPVPPARRRDPSPGHGRRQANRTRLLERLNFCQPSFLAVARFGKPWLREGEGRAFFEDKKICSGFLREQICPLLPARVVSCVLPG